MTITFNGIEIDYDTQYRAIMGELDNNNLGCFEFIEDEPFTKAPSSKLFCYGSKIEKKALKDRSAKNSKRVTLRSHRS